MSINKLLAKIKSAKKAKIVTEKKAKKGIIQFL